MSKKTYRLLKAIEKEAVDWHMKSFPEEIKEDAIRRSEYRDKIASSPELPDIVKDYLENSNGQQFLKGL